MDLNIMLWVGGMFFSLGIFAIKVGLGLGYGSFSRKLTVVVLGGYTALFMMIAVAAERLMKLAGPLLQKGPYTHTFLAVGLIVWGMIVIFKSTGLKEGNAPKAVESFSTASLLMIVPCPICLSAMIFSTWAALNAVSQPPLLLGLCLGVIFSVMALLVTITARLRTGGMPQTSLGMAMIVVGLYFVLSLFLPAKIEAARGMYASFVTENQAPVSSNTGAVLVFMLVLLSAGFFIRKKREE